MDIETRMRQVEREIISRRPEHSVDLALDRMTELVVAYAPWVLHTYRIENIVVHPWVLGYKYDSYDQHPWMYLDLDVAQRKGATR